MDVHDLGHGVRVARHGDGACQVTSRTLALPWSIRSGHLVNDAG